MKRLPTYAGNFPEQVRAISSIDITASALPILTQRLRNEFDELLTKLPPDSKPWEVQSLRFDFTHDVDDLINEITRILKQGL